MRVAEILMGKPYLLYGIVTSHEGVVAVGYRGGGIW